MSISDFAEQKPPEGSGTNWTEGEPSTSAPTATESKTLDEVTTPPKSDAAPDPQANVKEDPKEDAAPPVTSSVTVASPNGVATTQDILSSILDKIGDIGTDYKLKLMIIGPPGQGKSSFLASANNMLAYDFEDGLISAYGSPFGVGKGTQAIPYGGMNEFRNLVGGFVNEDPRLAPYKVFGLDTLSDLHKRDLAEICDREWRKQPSRNRYVPETDQYTEVNERIVRVVRALRDLPIDIVINSHSRTVEPKGKAAKTYADFSESLSNKVMAMMDVVGYLQFKEIDKELKTVLRVKTEGTIYCKTRVPMPAEIINPSFQTIKDLWVEGIKSAQEQREKNNNQTD